MRIIKSVGRIRKRKGKAFLKGLFILSFLLIGILLFLTKSDFFNIKEVYVKGENLTLEESLKEKGKSFIGENILFLKSKEVISSLNENPYVKSVNISRKLPNKLILDVEESDVAFYIGKGKNAYILSSNLRILEKNNNGNLNSDIKNLVEITGIKLDEIKIGDKLIDAEDKIVDNICKNIYEIKKVNKTKHKINRVDFSNLSRIIIWIGQVEIRVGDGTDFISKVNTALNILENKELKMEKGYIDLSFDGSPIINRGESK
ncbi:cell division protein FtsQ/DivIB [uncultured Clostridium sp.]|uniref:cell division protein FtsQ/DivIB n=1 Tax=uncultured Clostridium sp. TaxID=59620 RepID=UPI00258E1128|nr:FtsQ-type POTRA domain-containing protein [uncultured Clostridium sp.]